MGSWDLHLVRQNRDRVTKPLVIRRELESSAKDGDSPVGDGKGTLGGIPSSPEHVKFWANLRGPSRKAKYTPATDSEQVP